MFIKNITKLLGICLFSVSTLMGTQMGPQEIYTETPIKRKGNEERKEGPTFEEMLKNAFDEVLRTPPNKELIMLMGCTGAGKSTTLAMLLGRKLKKEKTMFGSFALVNSPDESRRTPNIANSSNKRVNVNFNIDSCTMYPTCYKAFQDIYYCDCPGFEDTGGKEPDICVALSIRRTIQRSGGVRALLFVIDGNLLFTNKAKNLKATAEAWSNLVRNPKQHATATFFIITKLPVDEDTPKDFSQLLGAMIYQNSQRNNNRYSPQFEHFLTQMRDNPNNMFFIPCSIDKKHINPIIDALKNVKSSIPAYEFAFAGEQRLKCQTNEDFEKLAKAGTEMLEAIHLKPKKIEKLKEA